MADTIGKPFSSSPRPDHLLFMIHASLRRRGGFSQSIWGALILVLVATSALRAQMDVEAAVAPLPDAFDRFCLDCHSGGDPTAGLDLEAWLDTPAEKRDAHWLALALKAEKRVRAGDMPPSNAVERPTAEERSATIGMLHGVVDAGLPQVQVRPGRVTTRRLSRVEVGHTLQALFGVDPSLADRLPSDDLGYGFDNVGDALTMSTLGFEAMLAVAEEVSAKLHPINMEPGSGPLLSKEAGAGRASNAGYVRGDGAAQLYSAGWVEIDADLPRPGRYRFEIDVSADQAGTEGAKVWIDVEGRRRLRKELKTPDRKVSTLSVSIDVPTVFATVRASFPNDFYNPKAKDPSQRDRNLQVHAFRVIGPLDHIEPAPELAWLHAADPGSGSHAKRLRKVVPKLLRRAWRRPATSTQVRRIEKLATTAAVEADRFEAGLELAVQAALVSPHFLFRLEPGGLRARGDEPLELDDYAVATRLSYFLWSAPPDEALLRDAKRGYLGTTESVREIAARMLADPRGDAIATNFAAQWLELRNLAQTAPDPDRFGAFDPELSSALRRESELLVRRVLRDRAPVSALLTSRETFLNARLAKHYGMKLPADAPEVEAGWRLVPVPAQRAPGILGHGSVHAITSNPTRTSPVKRGLWVLANLLDQAPPPPPPGADSFEDEEAIDSAASLRESLAKHRADARCASCHDRMDAIGLALEGFDPVGRPRSQADGQPVDTSATLPDGTALAGVADLSAALAEDPDLVRALGHKLFIYGIGRAVTPEDTVALERLIRGLEAKGPVLLADLVLGIVELDAFRLRDAQAAK